MTNVKPLLEFWDDAVTSVLSTTLKAKVWGLGGFFWTQVKYTVEAVKSANSCMVMQTDSPNYQSVTESVHVFGLWCGWEQPGPLLSVFLTFAHVHVTV